MCHVKDRVIQVTKEIGRGDDSQLSTRVVINPRPREVRAVGSICIQTIPTGWLNILAFFDR